MEIIFYIMYNKIMQYILFTSIFIICILILVLYLSNIFKNKNTSINSISPLIQSIIFGIIGGILLTIIFKYLLVFFGYCKPKSIFKSWNPYSKV